MNGKDQEMLKRILELKKKFEKDLQKKGVRIEKKDKKKTTHKAKMEIKYISIPIEEARTIVDVNMFDYKNTAEDIANYFERNLAGKSEKSYQNQYAVMYILKKEYDKVKELIKTPSFPEDYFNLGTAKLLSGDKDVEDFAEEFSRRLPQSYYSYLFTAMLNVYKGYYGRAADAIRKAAETSNDPLYSFLIAMYEKDVHRAKEHISKVFLKGRVKFLASLYQGMLHYLSLQKDMLYTTRKLFEIDLPCANCLLRLAGFRVAKIPPEYCFFWKTLEIFEYERSGRFESYLESTERHIIGFLGFFNYENKEMANEEFAKIVEVFGNVRIIFFPGDSHIKGLKSLDFGLHSGKAISLVGPNYFGKIKEVIRKLEESEKVRYDFAIDIPFFEPIRMLFGWRICEGVASLGIHKADEG